MKNKYWARAISIAILAMVVGIGTISASPALQAGDPEPDAFRQLTWRHIGPPGNRAISVPASRAIRSSFT